MLKIGIVSCDKWQGKINEDLNLQKSLENNGMYSEIISWEQPLHDTYDALILRSVWGYQNKYEAFKKWLLSIQQQNIPLFNSPNIVLDNINKDKQFSILQNNDINFIKTLFLTKEDINQRDFLIGLRNLISNKPTVIKPSISGSGNNTFILNPPKEDFPNSLKIEDIRGVYNPILNDNPDCKVMLQPYIEEINDGEYSCIFIDGELTHTMLRFPNIFHDKKRAYLLDKTPAQILELANRVAKIKEFNGYLYMRVDMVLINNIATIMEVELAEPDLLTRYIDDTNKQSEVLDTFARKIKVRTRQRR